MIKFSGKDYFDDRMYVLEVSKITVNNHDFSEQKEMWSVITRHNSPGYYPTRTDDFEIEEEAIDFYKKIAPQTPMVSMKGKPLEPAPDFDSFVEFLSDQNISIKIYNSH